MVVLISAFLFSIVLIGVAFKANARFRSEQYLPMQWWFTGEVTWSAPRVFALAFIPALAICILAAHSFLALKIPPRAGQEGQALPSLLAIGVIFLGVQLFHLWMVEKTLRRNGE